MVFSVLPAAIHLDLRHIPGPRVAAPKEENGDPKQTIAQHYGQRKLKLHGLYFRLYIDGKRDHSAEDSPNARFKIVHQLVPGNKTK